jgi:hypothetical protein
MLRAFQYGQPGIQFPSVDINIVEQVPMRQFVTFLRGTGREQMFNSSLTRFSG